MAYCTSDQVQGEFKKLRADSTSPIDLTEIDRFIEEADAIIDSYLSKRYETPVTGATSLIIVRNISIMIVAQRIKDILRVKTGDEPTSQDGRGNLNDRAMKMLKDIVDRNIDLPDATATDTDEGVQSYVSSNEVPFIFERETVQW
jgi:phage gp36-like protein